MRKAGDIFAAFFLLAVVAMLVSNQNTITAIGSFTTAFTSLVQMAIGTNGTTGQQGGTTQ